MVTVWSNGQMYKCKAVFKQLFCDDDDNVCFLLKYRKRLFEATLTSTRQLFTVKPIWMRRQDVDLWCLKALMERFLYELNLRFHIIHV